MKYFKKDKFLIPFIKLIGYGRNQTYQCQCLKCKILFFNLEKQKDLNDLFCEDCEPDEKYLTNENISPVNFLGIILGWEIKSTFESKKRSFYNYLKIYKRDKYQCQYCGYSPRICNDFRALHIDHLKPWTSGGSNKMDNLVVSCEKCNIHASDKWFDSFYEKKKYINTKVDEIPKAFLLIDEIDPNKWK